MARRDGTVSTRGFTLTEILVAIGVLLAVVVVTGRIFKIATDVSKSGMATVAVMQEAAAIETQIRQDIASMTREGFLAIHGVGVPNDINITQWQSDGSSGTKPSRLDVSLPADATIRCDQLLFFREAVESSQAWNEATTASPFPNAQALNSMMLYGHGIQLPELRGYTPVGTTDIPLGDPPAGWGHDPLAPNDANASQTELDKAELTPWRFDNPSLDETEWLPTKYTDYSSPTANIFRQQQPDEDYIYINGSQPESRQWTLARMQVLLADDDNKDADAKNKRQYLNNVPSALSIFAHDVRQTGGSIGGVYAEADPPVLAYGRVDVAASTIDEIRRMLQVSRNASNPSSDTMRRCAHPYDQLDMGQASGVGAGNSYGVGQLLVEPRAIKEVPSQFDLPGNTYLDQRFFMKDAFFRPRAERAPQGESKVDQVLASHTLGSACSSFIVEWTWGEGVGEAIVPRDQAPSPDGIMSTEPPRDYDCWHGVHYSAADPLLVIPDTDDPAWASTEPWLDQRWFGLRDIERGVMSFEEFQENFPRGSNNLCDVTYSGTMAPFALGTDAYAIDEDVQSGFGQNTPYEEYWATFGYNQEGPSLPLDVDGDETRDVDRSFAPWPTALRITMTLHDPEGRLAQGQVYQFVVQLPGQAQGQLAGGR